MIFESDFAKGFDNITAIIAETNFLKLYYPAFGHYKNCSMAKMAKLDKSSQGRLYIATQGAYHGYNH